jgi:glycosyltransferase involved in cell wall biosynthesis
VKKPIIFACNDPYTRDRFEQYKAGICIQPRNPIAVATAILTLYNLSTSGRNEMGQNAYHLAQDLFSATVVGNKLSALLDLNKC